MKGQGCESCAKDWPCGRFPFLVFCGVQLDFVVGGFFFYYFSCSRELSGYHVV